MLYYLGIRESELQDCDDLFAGSITYFGTNKKTKNFFNRSYNACNEVPLDHNDGRTDSLWNNFVKQEVQKIQKVDKNAQFMYYNQHYACLQKALFDLNIICLNHEDLINKLNDKFFVRDMLKDTVKNIDYKIVKGNKISLKYLKTLFNDADQFVVQSQTGSGGHGTFLLNSKTQNFVIKELMPGSYYHVSKYIECYSISTHVVIGKHNIVECPFALQVIKLKDNCLKYIGGDFSGYHELVNDKVDMLAKKQTLAIAKIVQKLGWLGVLGLDFVVRGDDLYFMELNPRFQSSTQLLNTNLKKHGYPSLHKLNFMAFNGETLPQIDNFCGQGAFLLRSFDDKEEHDAKPQRVVVDANLQNIKKVPGVYYCTEFFDHSIVDKKDNLSTDDRLKLKLQLMQEGVKIDFSTMKNLKGALYDDYVTCSGIMIKIGGNHSRLKTHNLDDLYLTEREYVTASLNDKSKFVFTTDEDGNFILTDRHGKVLTSDIGISRPKLGQVESSPVAIHGDRIRVSLITGCSGDCRFCGLNKLKYVVNDFSTIKDYIDSILKRDKNVSRLFITGGNPKEDDLGIVLTTLEQLINEYKKCGINNYDFMFAPRGLDKYFYEENTEKEYEKFLLRLKKIGVTTVAVDMELSNQKILKSLAPFKYKIGTKNYLKTLELAVKIFGEGNVRSNIIVGLESHDDSIKAVKSLLKIGAEPCLSPYEPYAMLPEIKKPTWEFLYNVYKDAINLCDNCGIKLAPSKYATDTHNSVASARYIPMTLSEYEAFFNCIKDVQVSVKRERSLNSK